VTKKNLITLIIILGLPMLILSQDAEPTWTADDLYGVAENMNFPQEVEFELFGVRAESAIQSLTLTLTSRGAEPIVITFDPDVVGITGAGMRFRYRWQISKDSPPILFSKVRYTWDIVTTDNISYEIVEDFDFIDQRVAWEQSNDILGQVNIIHAFGQLDADFVRSGVRATYNVLYPNPEDRPRYTFLVYPQNVTFGCDLNDEEEPIIQVRGTDGFEDAPCDLSLANDIYDERGYIVLNQTSVDLIQRIILDLMVKDYYLTLWNDVPVPDWFLDGLQQFYDPRTKRSALNLSQQKSRSDDLLRLADLETEPAEDEEILALWEAQSIGLILYIADTIGVDGLFEFAESVGNFDSFAEAYEDHVGQSIDLLMLSWRDWVFRSSSQQDYDFNPYMAETSTPTATATATNTPTATFTPSKTPDVTATIRPSFTPIPAPPTTTPLPAQSFSVQPTKLPPTPIPEAPPEQFTIDDGLLMRGAMGGAVILVLLVLLYFVLRRQ
jgi:hypothetical protein